MDRTDDIRIARLALLGGEGLRQPESGVWPRLLARNNNDKPQIALVTAALGTERIEMREQRTRLIAESLSSLGTEVMITEADDLNMPGNNSIVALQHADIITMAGGDAVVLAEVLRDSIAWQAIQMARQNGALLIAAGGTCTALGDICFGPIRPTPADATAFELEIAPGLGILPGVAVLPYFAWLQPEMVTAIGERTGDGRLLIGIDDQAGLVWDGTHWSVLGAGSVTVIPPNGPRKIYDAGQPVVEGHIPPPAPPTATQGA